MKKEFDLPKVTITFDDNIIFTRYKSNVDIELEDAKAISDLVYENMDKSKIYGQISDIRAINNISRQARDFFGSRTNEQMKPP